MNCAEAEELLGAYALNALPREELASVLAHLASCTNHARQARELRLVASAIGGSTEPAAPPPGLRARVLDAIALTPQASADDGAPRSIADARARRASPARLRSWRPAYALGTLAAAVIIGLVAWNIVLQTGGGDGSGSARYSIRNATSISTLHSSNAGGWGMVLYFEDEKKVAIVGDGMPQLDSSKTYQLWALGGDKPVSLGTFSSNPNGHMYGMATFDADAAQAVAITIEPAGGSEQPTSAPIYTAEIPA